MSLRKHQRRNFILAQGLCQIQGWKAQTVRNRYTMELASCQFTQNSVIWYWQAHLNQFSKSLGFSNCITIHIDCAASAR